MIQSLFKQCERKAFIACLVVLATLWNCASAPEDSSRTLANEVATKGWIVYGARTVSGDWDLFLMRPDGSKVRNLTQTSNYNEGLPRFSLDGHRLIYRRLPKAERFDNNRHGVQGELMIARADGSQARAFGGPGEYPWACLSPDGQSLAILAPSGIAIIDIASKKEKQRLNRKGFFQQIAWSPDGQWLAGVANSYDTGWSVARLNISTGISNPVSTVDCCTPDWFPDSQRVVFSRRPSQWTQLWMADAASHERNLLFAEDGRHVYGGCISPDGKYVLFTGNKNEDGDPQNSGAPMGLMRLADAPILGGDSAALRAAHPNTKIGPVLRLPSGWEPHWTYKDLQLEP